MYLSCEHVFSDICQHAWFSICSTMSDMCFFSDIPVSICLHAKTCVSIMYYMRLHHVYICITPTNWIYVYILQTYVYILQTYVYILQTYVGHDRQNKKHMFLLTANIISNHVKTCNLLSRCHFLIPACPSCFMTEVTCYYYQRPSPSKTEVAIDLAIEVHVYIGFIFFPTWLGQFEWSIKSSLNNLWVHISVYCCVREDLNY